MHELDKMYDPKDESVKEVNIPSNQNKEIKSIKQHVFFRVID